MPGQRAVEDIDVALAVAEDQRVLDVLAGDQPAQRFALVARLDDDERLLDQLRPARPAAPPRSRPDRSGTRRRGGGFPAASSPRRTASAGFSAKADDPLDIRDETHVEHAVGFVDDQDAHVRQQDLAALEQVEHAARGRDQHIDAAVELALLLVKAFAADQQRGR